MAVETHNIKCDDGHKHYLKPFDLRLKHFLFYLKRISFDLMNSMGMLNKQKETR